MSYLPEDIRTAIINRINAVSTAHAVFHRAPIDQYDAYPAYVLEYGSTENAWTSNGSDKKQFGFNLYVVYKIDETDASRELAEKAISDAIGELYRVVFQDPGALNLPNGWVRLSNASWGYGGGGDIPMRMAQLQIEVTVHQDRA